MIRRRFILTDLNKLRLRPEDKDRDLEVIARNADKMLFYSYFDGDQIVGIVGVIKINDNTCEVFVIGDKCASRYARQIYKHSIGFLEELQKTFGRIQAIVRTDWDIAIKYLDKMQFDAEGILRRFSPNGDDYYLFARIK